MERGDPRALPTFWTEVATRGAPLVEPIAGDTGRVLVTFLYHGDSTTKNVVLFRGVNVTTNLADNPLARLGATDVWYRSYPVRRDARFTYLIGANIDLSGGPERFMTQMTSMALDPLNPLRDPDPRDPPPKHAPSFYVHSAVELPGAPPQPWIAPRGGVARGAVAESTFSSAILGNTRDIAVYTPAGFAADRGPYPVLVVFDGDWYRTLVPTPTILDNLIAAKRIPPVVAVFVDNPGRSRSEELYCNRKFDDFLATELLPWMTKRWAAATDPARTTVAGSSAGGIGAACAALFHSERIGNVLSLSGAYWWAPPGDSAEWARRQFAASPTLPIRFYLEAGLLENTTAILPANRRFSDLLREKHYEMQYVEFNGGHEYRNWRGGIANGLIALLGGRVR
jgi:enterochelin esterase family protein